MLKIKGCPKNRIIQDVNQFKNFFYLQRHELYKCCKTIGSQQPNVFRMIAHPTQYRNNKKNNVWEDINAQVINDICRKCVCLWVNWKFVSKYTHESEQSNNEIIIANYSAEKVISANYSVDNMRYLLWIAHYPSDF